MNPLLEHFWFIVTFYYSVIKNTGFKCLKSTLLHDFRQARVMHVVILHLKNCKNYPPENTAARLKSNKLSKY